MVHSGAAPECGPALANGTCPDGFHACMKHGPVFRVISVTLDATFDRVADMDQHFLVHGVMDAVQQAVPVLQTPEQHGGAPPFPGFRPVHIQRDFATGNAVLQIVVPTEHADEVVTALSQDFCFDAADCESGTEGSGSTQICQSAAATVSATETFPMLDMLAASPSMASEGGEEEGHSKKKFTLIVVVVVIIVAAIATAFAVRRYRKNRVASSTLSVSAAQYSPATAGKSKLELMSISTEAAPVYEKATTVRNIAFSNPAYGVSP